MSFEGAATGKRRKWDENVGMFTSLY